MVLAALLAVALANSEGHSFRILPDVVLSPGELSDAEANLALPAKSFTRTAIEPGGGGALLTDSHATFARSGSKHMRVERDTAGQRAAATKGFSTPASPAIEADQAELLDEEPQDNLGETEAIAAAHAAMKANGRWITHVRALCSASFAGGLTVGIVGTLLMLSLGLRDAEKLRTVSGSRKEGSAFQAGTASAISEEPKAPEATPQDSNTAAIEPASSPTSVRCTDSVESIHRFGPRLAFLVAMLLVQSLSSFMLAGFQDLIQNHPSIVFFLTMVVGTGGNVGGQSVVLAVRRLAYGEQVDLGEQVAVGTQLSMVLGPLALLRAYVQGTKLSVCFTIGVATLLIVVVAASLGTALPRLLWQVRVDPAHATPVIQVLMDMVGVLTTCAIGYVILDVMLKPAA